MVILSFLLALFAPLLDSLESSAVKIVGWLTILLVAVGCVVGLWYDTNTTAKVLAVILLVDDVLAYFLAKGVINLPSLTPTPAPAPKPVTPIPPKPSK